MYEAGCISIFFTCTYIRWKLLSAAEGADMVGRMSGGKKKESKLTKVICMQIYMFHSIKHNLHAEDKVDPLMSGF